MYNAIRKIKKKFNNNWDKLLSVAIIMFVSFSILNIFLIFSFMNMLNNIAII